MVSRFRTEGMGFLTKSMPRLGKAFDKALAGIPMTSATLGFKTQRDSELPIFLGEFFNRVLDKDGALLSNPCAISVAVIRQITYLFYKYELPYTLEQEQLVIQKFKQTDASLLGVNDRASALYRDAIDDEAKLPLLWTQSRVGKTALRRARILLERLFARFDPMDIKPRHGPGAVATKQKLWDKYLWTNVSENITTIYPLDTYFYASLGHVCDDLQKISSVGSRDLPARVVLVPKDSRGPRLISCEPVDYQWIQQGLGRAIVKLAETHELTKFNVFFTDQSPNQRGALLGSSTGRYATLDLNEASDRVSVGLVRLLFPKRIFECLMACRSSSTVLPDGEELRLQKFAPMGSSLCFPILALTVWAVLSSGAPNADTRKSVLVYGDDVIVPTAYAADAIERLELVGLKVNKDKSCTSGLFRESCGTDAFNGVNVTPVRFRTVWSSLRSPNVYLSYIAYANELRIRGYTRTAMLIAAELHRYYGEIPSWSQHLCCPSLRGTLSVATPKTQRSNKSLQKLEWKVWDLSTPKIHHELPGWFCLLRYFSEAGSDRSGEFDQETRSAYPVLPDRIAFRVSSYTRRDTSKLVKRWR